MPIVDTYGLFINVDSSILKLNSVIERYGYKFESFTIAELEKYFLGVFSSGLVSSASPMVKLQDGSIVSDEFYQTVLRDTSYGMRLLMNDQIFMLKKSDSLILNGIDQIEDINIQMKIIDGLREFIENLIQQLRLYKRGAIECPTQFQIDSETRHVGARLWSHKILGYSTYVLNDVDIENLQIIVKERFKANELTSLAISNFNLIYETRDVKTVYMTLMTCLESIFNTGRDQITHTISRHLALILAKNEDEFHINYYKIKEFYKLRSGIVHGSPIANVEHAADSLEELVRQAINYCIKQNLSKQELFKKLNAMGYASPPNSA